MKERLTGAIILVAVIVLLVPELLSGPKGRSAPAPATPAAGTATEEPPLRSYTINLGDGSQSQAATTDTNGPAMPQPERSEGNPEKRQGRDAGQPERSEGNPEKRQGRGAEQPTMPASEGEPQQPAGALDTPKSPATAGAPQGQGSTPSIRSQAQTTPPPKPDSVTAPHESKPAHAPPPEPKSARAPLPEPKSAAKAPVHSKPANPSKPASSPALASNSSVAKPNKPPTAASRSESGWAVQLGVFSSHENAERLALEVRVKGFKASVSPVTSGSRKLYRVRVGPTPDRAAAQELQTRLKAAGRPGGAIVPYS